MFKGLLRFEAMLAVGIASFENESFPTLALFICRTMIGETLLGGESPLLY